MIDLWKAFDNSKKSGVNCNDGDFPWFFDSRKISGATDIGTPNGPAEEGTRGLLKAHDPKFMELRSPINIDMESRDRLGIEDLYQYGKDSNKSPGLCNLYDTKTSAPPLI